MRRRESDRLEVIKTESRKIKNNFNKDPKVENLIIQLGQTENRKILLACGELLLFVELNYLIKIQEKEDEEKKVYNIIKREIYKILEDLSQKLSASDFDFVKDDEKDAIIRIVGFLIEKNKEKLLLDIVKKCTKEEIAKQAAWYFIRKMDFEKIREINNEAVCSTIKNLTAQRTN